MAAFTFKGYDASSKKPLWWAPTKGIVRKNIGEIHFEVSYNCSDPVDTWFASEDEDVSVYVEKLNDSDLYKLTIAPSPGKETEFLSVGAFYAPKDATKMFGRVIAEDDYFDNVNAMVGLGLLNTSKTENMNTMFQACHKLEELDLRNFDTSNVTNMQGVFSSKSGEEMRLVNIRGIEDFNVSAVTVLYYMFGGCARIKSLDLSRWTVSSACTDMRQVFKGCTLLERISGINKWPVSTNTDVRSMFQLCTHLRELDLSKWELGTNAKTADLLWDTTGLERLVVGATFSATSATLGNPTSDHITAADGKWYTLRGESYTAANMPGNRTITYYASPLLVEKVLDTPVLLPGRTVLGMANAIREKTGGVDDLLPAEYEAAIRSI